MRVLKITATALAAIVLWPTLTSAQEKAAEPPPPHYRLTYRMLQVGSDGKISNSRTYSTIVVADSGHGLPAKIRTGDRIPVPVGAGSTQYQYQDIGTNIDTFQSSVHDRQLSLQVSAESSSMVKGPTDGPGGPLIRRTSWESGVVVTLDKPTIIFTSDNVSDTGKTELELSATEIDHH